MFPITEAVAEEFQKEKKGAVKVTVGISGTGGGFKKFCRGEIDISDASRPIKKSEMEDCAKAGIKYVELPIAYDALTVVIHPQNTWAKTLTVADLKKMWEPDAQGKITNWNQVRPDFPDVPLKLYGPGTDSGTFEYFTEAIVGKAKASRADYTASEDDNVRSCRAFPATRAGSATSATPTTPRNMEKLGAASIDGGKGPRRTFGQERRGWNLSASVPADLHLRERKVAGEARGQGIRALLPEARHRQLGEGSEVRVRCPPAPTRSTLEHVVKDGKTGNGLRRQVRGRTQDRGTGQDEASL